MTRPFRFGVQTGAPPDRAAWREQARRVEALGYATLLVPDHVGGDDLAPIPAIAAAADATTTLRLGTLVINNDLRHPALLARDVASLDVLSGGRIELGIGAGWASDEYGWLGIEFDDAAVRVDRLEEAVRIIRQTWSGDVVTATGTHYGVDGLPGVPRPVQRTGPPILVAGGGRMVTGVAARTADIVGVHLRMRRDGTGEDWTTGTEAAVAERIETIRSAAGSRFESLELQLVAMTLEITDDARAGAARIGAPIGQSAGEVLASPYRFIGSTDVIAERIRALRDRFGISYIVVPGRWMEIFAPIAASLAGT